MSHTRSGRWHARGLRTALFAAVLLGLTASCAYYNTFYLARKYYLKATDGQPYEVDRENTTQRSNYTKSGDYSKKLLGVYPKSKYVDDAWLMWARTLIGTDDPLKAVTMLEEFRERFPDSELRPDAEFFLGLSYRAARKHELAVSAFDEFLVQAPKHELVPYAWYERSKALMSLQRYREAAESAGQILDKFRGHILQDRALRQRAEARYQQRDWPGAQADFHTLGARALTDDERLKFLLREVDCLESSRDYEQARAVLRDARSHTVPPPPIPEPPRVSSTPNANGTLPQQPPPAAVIRTPAQEVYGRLTLRMGGVELLAGRIEPAVEYYKAVLADYPRSQLAAEAQYRIAYAYETGANDFARARVEYPKVREQIGMSQFAQQADQRLENLDRIERFRTAGGADSLARKAEARFLVAELFLFSQDKPERAVQEYRAIADSDTVAATRARALNAQAWVLARKLGQKQAADSLFWKVVREFPATEAQLAARDYLESEGVNVPENLIVAPKSPSKLLLDPSDDSLTEPPAGTTPLGRKPEASIPEPGAVRFGPGVNPPATPVGNPSQWRYSHLPDSLRRSMMQRDSLLALARRDTSATGRARVDSLRRALARPDTTGRGALLAEIQKQAEKAGNVVVSPDATPPPDFQADTTGTGPSGTASLGLPRATAPGARAMLPPASRAGVPPAIVKADSARRLPPRRVAGIIDTLRQGGVRPAVTPDTASRPALVVPDSILAARAEQRRRAMADSLERDVTMRRMRAQTDSLARARAVADSLAAHPPKKQKVKAPSDPNVGFSSVWSKSKPDSVKRAEKAQREYAKQLKQEEKEKEQQEKAAREAQKKAQKQAKRSPAPAADSTARKP